MRTPSPAPQTALRYEVEVLDHGQVALRLPYAVGTRVTIIAIPEPQEQFRSRCRFYEQPSLLG